MVYFSKKDTYIDSDGTEYSDSKVSGSLSATNIMYNKNTKTHECGNIPFKSKQTLDEKKAIISSIRDSLVK